MNNSDCRPVDTSETVQLLIRHSDDIKKTWLDELKKAWGEEGLSKIDLIAMEQERKEDLLSILIHHMSGNTGDEKRCREGVIDRVRGELYSVEDFLTEVECLENAVEEVLRRPAEGSEIQILDVLNHVRKRLGTVLRNTVQQTCEVYERIVESGARGFCLFGADGTIVATNNAMKDILETRSATGRPLESLFDGENRVLFRDKLSKTKDGKSQMWRSHIRTDKGNAKPVGIEIASLISHWEVTGGYLCAVDLSSPERTERDIFGKFSLGVTKQTLDEGAFTYMNDAALGILGLEKWEGRTLRDVFPDDKDYLEVKKHLIERSMGKSGEYTVEAMRPVDRKKFPVSIAAVPETDLQGNIIGSVAIVRDLSVEKASENIYGYIATTKDYREMLTKVVQEVSNVIPFDRFIITLYNAEMTHLREFYTFPRTGRTQSNIRWWPISAFLKEFLNTGPFRVDNIGEFLNEPQWQHLKATTEFKRLRDEGFQSFLRYNVIEPGKVVAGIALLSKTEKTYSKEQEDLLKRLPLDNAVLMALHYEEERGLEFRLRLVEKIVSVCHTVRDVAETIVEELAAHYEWEYVSLFRIDEKKQQLTLVLQKTGAETHPLPEAFTLPLGKGVLSHVYGTGKPVNISNVMEDPKFRDIYVRGVDRTLSEVCIPIVIQSKVFYLLNIEDRHENAFSEEDLDSLLQVVQEIENVLDRVWVHHFLQTILDSTSDLVFVTNRQEKIGRPNQETMRQLGYSEDEMKALEVKDILADLEGAREVIEAPICKVKEIKLVRKDGSRLPVLLSSSELPEDFEGKVFVCKDASLFERVKELEYLTTMYHEIAIQTQTPLSLAFGWIQRMKKTTRNKEIGETLGKALKQLSKVEMTYNRLALYDQEEGVLPYREVLLSVSEVADYVLSEFPESERNRISDKLEEKLPYLRGDLFQLTFCLETILSFLLRYLPQDEKIRLEIFSEDGWVITRIAGFMPDLRDQRSVGLARQEAVAKTIMQMALGDEMIKRFVDNHKGKFFRETGEGSLGVFEIRLPFARGEEA